MNHLFNSFILIISYDIGQIVASGYGANAYFFVNIFYYIFFFLK